ncbi:MAG: GNAT family N-acetyltransferase [Clostridia bacterium]|nr:GNAT family N-acetyltransferase [Clostridia bacterium]
MGIVIVPWEDRFAGDFKDISVAWLEEFDLLEPIDLEMLDNPHRDILEPGGQIFFALEGDAVLGTCGMQPVEPGVYEVIKLGVRPEYRGRGAGKLLLESCLDWAGAQKARKVVLYSNSRLQSALRLYRRCGFTPIPYVPGHYAVSDIQMEQTL